MKLKYTLLATAIASASMNAQADLARQGPVSPANGYPTFYQDFGFTVTPPGSTTSTTVGPLALDLCLPNIDELADGSCLLLPPDVPNAALPIAFPNNFPEEAFWFNATTSTPMGGLPEATGNALLVTAMEAAFAGGPVAAGDQVVFSRVRYKFTAPIAGEYTVDTPYTHDVFQAEGGELVFNTVDIGINCAPGDFSCALKGHTAPFLRASDQPGGLPAPFFTTPAHPGNFYLADPAVETAVTGGTNGNSFKITVTHVNEVGVTVTTEIANTDLFSVMGRVRTGPLPGFTTLDRATYSRDATSSQVDVYATSIRALGSPIPKLQLLASDIPGTYLQQDPARDSKFQGHVVPIGNALPVTVAVANVSDQTVLTAELTDLVSVTKAEFLGGILTVTASSSDKAVPPVLTVTGSNGVVYGQIDTASVNPTLAVSALSAPDTLTVSSSAGGKTTLPIITDAAAVRTPTQAVNDSVTTIDGAELAAIAVLANDFVPQDTTGLAPIVRIVRSPEHGTATVNATTNTVAYSPAAGFGGLGVTDSFTYYIDNGNQGLSNIATVLFNVPLINRSPVAGNDAFGVARGAGVRSLTVLVNDTDPDANRLSVASAQLTTTGTLGTNTGPAGTVGVSPDGQTVTYTPPAIGTIGSPTQTITYTLSDGQGGTAQGTVTLTLVNEGITVSTATYDLGKRQWNIQGTDTPATTNVVLTMYAGSVIDPTKIIGTATTDATGRFRLPSRLNNPVGPAGIRQITIESSRGRVVTVNHN